MLLKDVTVKTILNGKYHKLWEQMGKKFVLKMKNRHNLSDGEVKMLVEMLNDKGVVGQGIDFYKETISNQGVVGGGAKKKSRRRKKKKKAKKTKKRYRRGGSGPDVIPWEGIILGIIGIVVAVVLVRWDDPDIANRMRVLESGETPLVFEAEADDDDGEYVVTTKSAAHARDA
jgi:hypothetical protein